jgi:hypothetical protein
MALADFIPPGTRITSGPANSSQMQIVQPVANMTSVARTPLSTTKSFLDQLQETAGLLSNEIASVGNFTPRLASDYITTPFGEPIAQNRFVGNRFEMPNLMGATYNTRGFNPIQGGQFNFNNMGTYNPGAFNQFYQAPMTSPAMTATTTTSQMRGGGENRNRSPMTDNRNISQIEADLENARLRNALLGLVNPAFGVLGLLSTLDDQRQVDNYRQSLIDKAQSIRDNRSASDAQSGFRGDTTAPGADASTIGGTGGRRGGAGPDQGRGGFGGDNTGGRDASGIGGTGGRRGGAGPN